MHEGRAATGLLESVKQNVAVDAHVADGDRHQPCAEVNGQHATSRPRAHVLAKAEEAAAGRHEVTRILEEMETDDVRREHAAEQLGAMRQLRARGARAGGVADRRNRQATGWRRAAGNQ